MAPRSRLYSYADFRCENSTYIGLQARSRAVQPSWAASCPLKHETRPCPSLPPCPLLDCDSGAAALEMLDGKDGLMLTKAMQQRAKGIQIATAVDCCTLSPPQHKTVPVLPCPSACLLCQDMYFAKGYSKVVWRARYGGQDVVVKRAIR